MVQALRLCTCIHQGARPLAALLPPSSAQGSLPHVVITSYEMMQRLTCDACKGRGGQQASVCSGTRPPCRDTQNCMASQRWRVVIVDGEQGRIVGAAAAWELFGWHASITHVQSAYCTCRPPDTALHHAIPYPPLCREPHTAHLQQASRRAAHRGSGGRCQGGAPCHPAHRHALPQPPL